MDSRLVGLVADIFRIAPAQVVDDLVITELPVWDSMKHIEFVVSVEERFQVQLTEDEIVALATVAGLRQVLAARGVTD